VWVSDCGEKIGKKLWPTTPSQRKQRGQRGSGLQSSKGELCGKEAGIKEGEVRTTVGWNRKQGGCLQGAKNSGKETTTVGKLAGRLASVGEKRASLDGATCNKKNGGEKGRRQPSKMQKIGHTTWKEVTAKKASERARRGSCREERGIKSFS